MFSVYESLLKLSYPVKWGFFIVRRQFLFPTGSWSERNGYQEATVLSSKFSGDFSKLQISAFKTYLGETMPIRGLEFDENINCVIKRTNL